MFSMIARFMCSYWFSILTGCSKSFANAWLP